MSHKFEKRCEARQNEIRAGSVARPADRSDNTASRACHLEVSAEQPAKNGLLLAEIRNPPSFNRYPFRECSAIMLPHIVISIGPARAGARMFSL